MKHSLLLSLLLCLHFFSTHSQIPSWTWSPDLPIYTRIADIASDGSGNAYYGGNIRKFSNGIMGYQGGTLVLGRVNAGGMFAWQDTFPGVGYISDIEISSAGKLLVAGGFRDSLWVKNNRLSGPDWSSSAFLFELDPNGNLLWLSSDSLTNSANHFISQVHAGSSGNLYCAGLTNDIAGFIEKRNPQGVILWRRTLENVRTVSDIVADAGKIYITGTCEPDPAFDSLQVQDSITTGYATFLAGLRETPDSSLAEWMQTRSWGTFDFGQCIELRSNELCWFHGVFENGNDWMEELRFSLSGNTVAQHILPSNSFSQEALLNNYRTYGNQSSIFAYTFAIGAQIYQNFNSQWDTLLVMPGNNTDIHAICTESSGFFLAGLFTDSLLHFPGSDTLVNSHFTQLPAEDIFIHYAAALPLSGEKNQVIPADFQLYSLQNESGNYLLKGNFSAATTCRVFSIEGKELGVMTEEIAGDLRKLDLSTLPNGMYCLQVSEKGHLLWNAKLIR